MTELMPTSDWPAVSLAAAHAELTAPGARFEIEEVLIRGVKTRTWKNVPPTLRDVFCNSRAFAERTFIVYDEERVTYDAFARATLTLAHALRARGVHKGDRVVIVMRNLPEWPVAYFAAALCGAIATPLNAWWIASELEYGLKDSAAKALIVDAEQFERLRGYLPDCPALRSIYITRSSEEIALDRVTRLEKLLGRVSEWHCLPELPLPDVPVHPDDDATIFYTSGTTGKPKGVLATHRSVVTNIFSSACSQARTFLRRGQSPPVAAPNDPQRIVLLVVPMFHVSGCNATLIPAINQGSRLVLMHEWNVDGAMQLIQSERVTSTGGVPAIAWQLVEHPSREKYDLSSIDWITYGGAPSAPELVRRINAVFPKASPWTGWGMTETSGTFTNNNSRDYENRPDSCGPAVPVGEIRIMSVDGSGELPCGEAGELWVKGPQIFKGYWNNPGATAESFQDGWIRTGDIARVDEEGFCYIVDRARDILIRGGENIYCIHVENALYEHPAVIDAAIVAVPHRTLGEEPGAIVSLTPGAQVTEEELRTFAAARLAPFEVPVRIVFWPEPLPRNAAGKILKRDLKKVFR
jgi:long-chain acyl-CoA synthetase